MAVYSLADLIIHVENRYDFLKNQCSQYEYGGSAPADFTIRVTDEDLCRERLASMGVSYSPGYLESVCAYRKIALNLPMYDAMLLHASVIDCGGRGIGFLARSGVGKTTHTLLWKQEFPEKVRIINGDKPIVRFFDGVPYAYGTPWAGKEGFQCKDRVQLTDICFIERGRENSVRQLDPMEYFNHLMVQTLHPSREEAAEKTLTLLDMLMTRCRFWSIRCNTSPEAAHVAYHTILGEDNNEA
jgi:hypothetical protein